MHWSGWRLVADRSVKDPRRHCERVWLRPNRTKILFQITVCFSVKPYVAVKKEQLRFDRWWFDIDLDTKHCIQSRSCSILRNSSLSTKVSFRTAEELKRIISCNYSAVLPGYFFQGKLTGSVGGLQMWRWWFMSPTVLSNLRLTRLIDSNLT